MIDWLYATSEVSNALWCGLCLLMIIFFLASRWALNDARDHLKRATAKWEEVLALLNEEDEAK